MAERNYKYAICPLGPNAPTTEFLSDDAFSRRMIAEDAARHHLVEGDVSDSCWSETFMIWELDGTLIGKFWAFAAIAIQVLVRK